VTTTSAPVAVFAGFVHDEQVGGAVSTERLLRLFDQLRREVAAEVAVDGGAGAGYDELSIDTAAVAAVAPGDAVTVMATVSAFRPRAHRVEYVATVVPCGTDRPHARVLATACGWTVATRLTR